MPEELTRLLSSYIAVGSVGENRFSLPLLEGEKRFFVYSSARLLPHEHRFGPNTFGAVGSFLASSRTKMMLTIRLPSPDTTVWAALILSIPLLAR